MKFYLKVILLFTLFGSFIECMIFVKTLHDDNYPGQCYPVHVRIGAKKKYDLIALKPGEEVNDPNVCGTTVCMTMQGLTYVYYCPRTLPSSGCTDDKALNTMVRFPQCCWSCSVSKDCNEAESFPSYNYPLNKNTTN